MICSIYVQRVSFRNTTHFVKIVLLFKWCNGFQEILLLISNVLADWRVDKKLKNNEISFMINFEKIKYLLGIVVSKDKKSFL